MRAHRHPSSTTGLSAPLSRHKFSLAPLFAGICLLAATLSLTACQTSSTGHGGTGTKATGEKAIVKALRRATKPSAGGYIVFGDQQVEPTMRELSFSGKPRDNTIVEMSRIGRIPSPRMEEYFGKVIARLLEPWEGPLPSIGVFLVPKSGFGASSLGTGDILVNIGTFNFIQSEDELAALLAHELSHILLNHFEREARAKQTIDVINKAAAFAVIGLYAANSKVSRYGNTTTISVANEGRLQSEYERATLYWMAAHTLSDDIFNSLWSRVQENEADQLGVDLLERAGYDIEAMVQVLDYQRQSDGKEKVLENALTPLLAKSGAVELIAGVLSRDEQAMQKGLFKVGAAVVTHIATNVGAKLLHEHQSPEARSKLVRSYIDKQYFDIDPPLRDNDGYQMLAKNSGVRSLVDNYGHMFEARDKFLKARAKNNSGLLREAHAELERGRVGATRSDPFGVMLAYQMEEVTGNRSKSLDILKSAKNVEYASLYYHQALAQEYAMRGDAAKSEEAITRGEKALNSRDLFLTNRIVTALVEQNPEKLAFYRAECARSAIQTVRENCTKAEETWNGLLPEDEGRAKTGVFSMLNQLGVPVQQPAVQQSSASAGNPIQSLFKALFN